MKSIPEFWDFCSSLSSEGNADTLGLNDGFI
jgi:hypothetical protein